jgi:flagellar basal-body rod modification protein FlgD
MTTTVAPLSNSNLLNSYIQQQQQAAASAAANSSSNASSSASASSANSISSLSGNFNTFINILTTQLKNQDPTAASDTNQFTQELVQFAGVEQQLNTNSDLSQLINLQKSSGGLGSSLGYIGKYVEAPTTTQIPLQSGQAELAYTLPSGVSNVTVNVLDSTGNTVATLTGPTTAGLDRVAWDGKDTSGNQLADGVYTFQFSATGPGSTPITVSDIRTVGLVTSVQSNSDGTSSLSLGTGMTINTSTVDAVYNSTSPPIAALGDPSSTSTTNQTTSG